MLTDLLLLFQAAQKNRHGEVCLFSHISFIHSPLSTHTFSYCVIF